eukprot:7994428-Alexandrium_andersonii.AAC.1
MLPPVQQRRVWNAAGAFQGQFLGFLQTFSVGTATPLPAPMDHGWLIVVVVPKGEQLLRGRRIDVKRAHVQISSVAAHPCIS